MTPRAAGGRCERGAEGALGKEGQAEARLTTLLASAEPLSRVDALRVQGLLHRRR
jgi:hypothetical protein